MAKASKGSKAEGAIKAIGHGGGKSAKTPAGTRIIAFANFKGGVGKTACAVNVAGCLADDFKRNVLLVDLDVQSSLGQWLLGPQLWLNRSKHLEMTSYQIFRDIIHGNHAWHVETATWSLETCPKLKICPATFEMINLDTQLHHVNKPTQPRPFQCLDKIIKDVCYQFDYVIFDCPPNMYMTTQNAIFCADFILIPTLPDFLSKAGLRKLVGFLTDLRDQFLLYDTDSARIAGVIINNFDITMKTLIPEIDEISAYVEQAKHESKVFLKQARVFEQRMHKRAHIAKAPDESLPITMAFPTSKAAAEFRLLTREIMEVLGDDPAIRTS